MKELNKQVEQWFIVKGLDKGRPEMQVLKFMEEFSELIVAVSNTHEDQVIDALGDMQVVSIGLHLQTDNELKNFDVANMKPNFDVSIKNMIIELGGLSEGIAKLNKELIKEFLIYIEITIDLLHQSLGYNRLDTLKVAYNEIKDRKGKVQNGNFIKSSDL